MKTFIKLLLVILIACPFTTSLLSSCAEESDCSVAGRPMLRGNFYQGLDERGDNIRVTVNYLTVRAFGTDSIILNAKEKADSITLPLRYTADSTVFVFQYNKEDPKQADTITILHKNTPFFISVDCGYEVKQTLTDKKFTKNFLDTIHVRNQDTNVDGTENLRFIFKSNDTDPDSRSIIGAK